MYSGSAQSSRGNSFWRLLLTLAAVALMAIDMAAVASAAVVPLTIRFDAPAQAWEPEGLPIGNGAMGAVITGNVQQETLQFNEKTLWSGGPGSVQGYDFGVPTQPQTQALARVRKTIAEQGSISPEDAAKLMGRDTKGYGDYQTFGNLVLTFAKNDSPVIRYKRELSLDNAQVVVSYSQGDVEYKREYFASYPDHVIALRISASKPGQINLSAALQVPDNRSLEINAKSNRLTASGKLNDNGLEYEAQIALIPQGGKLTSGDGKLDVQGADSLVILLSAATNYAQHYPDYRGKNPHHYVQSMVDAASQKNFEQLQARHQKDYQALYQRVQLDLGQQPLTAATPELLKQYHQGNSQVDRLLEATYFQLGRYLLISSSRAGSLPANLQGVWNNSTTPPWNDDYHVNINLQMNYWLAETTNLVETTPPLFDFVDSLVEPGKISAQKIAGAQGWTLFLNTNIWGFTGVISWPTAFWQPEAGAWLAQHFYEHYLFSGDKKFLKERAYPVMKGAAQFWLSFLIVDPRDGKLVVSPSFSPEQGPFTMGAAMSQQIVVDLLSNTAKAAEQLGDKKFLAQVNAALAKIDTGLRVGSWGQLQEWKEDLDDPKNQHRHISHLFALHPGSQIDVTGTPELLRAAATSLNARGDGGTGWSQAWKINMWARLHNGNRAYKLLGEQLLHSTLPNLWDNHPPFQIDGNFGATAGIAEMLLQSHNGVVRLLPALPDSWPTGAVTGLRARGGLTVDMGWSKRQLQQLTIHASQSGSVKIQTSLLAKPVALTVLPEGKTQSIKVTGLDGEFEVQGGRMYLLTAQQTQ